jgi:hypothetical protein
MGTITPTTPTTSQILAPVVITTGNVGTRTTLDLTTKRCAYLLGRIGRRVATALTRPGYIAIRKTRNAGFVFPNTRYDMYNQIAVAISNTVASGGASGTATVTLTSATSFAVGDFICLHSDDANANRVEFARIVSISSNTLTVEFNFATSHNAADRVTTMSENYEIVIPGGDIYEIRAVNNSGQDLVFALDAIIDPGDTTA